MCLTGRGGSASALEFVFRFRATCEAARAFRVIGTARTFKFGGRGFLRFSRAAKFRLHLRFFAEGQKRVTVVITADGTQRIFQKLTVDVLFFHREVRI